MTAVQFAKQMEVDYSTVMRWLRKALIPGAEAEDTPMGKVWQIPESALKMDRPKAGRRRADTDTEQDRVGKKAGAKKATKK